MDPYPMDRILDILVLLPGKTSAELRARIIDIFVRFVGGALA